MARHPHFAVDDLTDEARRMIRDGLERNRREKAIIAEIKARGERIATSSLNRYASWYRGQMRRRQEIQQRVEVAVKIAAERGQQMTVGMRAELLDVMYEAARDGKLAEMPPYFAGILAVRIADAERKDRELELRRDALELDRRKLEALEKRQSEIRAKAEKLAQTADARGLAPEVIAEIRELYGLTGQN